MVIHQLVRVNTLARVFNIKKYYPTIKTTTMYHINKCHDNVQI